MKYLIATVIVFISLSFGCRKEYSGSMDNISETFYVESAGSSMHVLIEGNIGSKVVLLVVHGGPGEGAFIYNTDYISENLEDKYALAYWDQRNSGSSQGNNNESHLTLEQMVDDLKKVIIVIRERYGADTRVFVLSHSFGGLIAAGFLTSDNNQDLISGYIETDGSHDYPRNDTLTRNMLLEVADTEIAKNDHVREWNKIVSWCESHPGNYTPDESLELEDLASKAESYIPQVTKVNFFTLAASIVLKDKLPLTSILSNYLSSENSNLVKEISGKEFTSVLKRITIPVLLLYGKFDFICPPSLGYEFYSGISSVRKRIVISPVSGHNLIFQDRMLFRDEVLRFVEENR